jgi:hypothetical protein
MSNVIVVYILAMIHLNAQLDQFQPVVRRKSVVGPICITESRPKTVWSARSITSRAMRIMACFIATSAILMCDYFRILLPVGQLAIVSTAILIFTFIWNEFLIAQAMTQGPFNLMATPVLAGLKGNYAQLWHIQMAGALITSIPPLLIFIFLGRFFVSGLMAGTLKG